MFLVSLVEVGLLLLLDLLVENRAVEGRRGLLQFLFLSSGGLPFGMQLL